MKTKSENENMIFKDKETKIIKELRFVRYQNLLLIRNNVERVFGIIKKKREMQSVIKSIPTDVLKSKTAELLDETCINLKHKIEADLPIDQDDIDFAYKTKRLKTPNNTTLN